jgi:hypothetical protein
MLTKVEVLTTQGMTLVLPLQDISSGYVVKDVDGLDPVKATIVSSSFGQLDGTEYQSSRRENRNITIKLGFEPTYSATDVRTLRNQLYKYLLPKSAVTLKFFENDIFVAYILGRVEAFETPLFSKTPEANVSIVCFKPDFIAPAPVLIPGNTVVDTTEQLLEYPGTTETGVVLSLAVNRSITEFVIYNRTAGGDMLSLDFVAPLLAGDVLALSTVSGNKYARLTRAGIQTPILYGVSPAASWINLFPGSNYFRVQATGVAIPFTITYQAKYGGL